MKVENGRDCYLDFLRGVAAVNIIFIHTAFWSGTAYVPVVIQTLTLILDVPFFFFLSGWSFTYTRSFTKSVRSIFLTYMKYVFFLVFYILCLFAVAGLTGLERGLTVENFLGNLFFLRPETTSLPVVMSSMWFLPVYFWVVPIGSVLLWALKRAAETEQANERDLYNILVFVVFAGLLYLYISGKKIDSLQRILFHLLFFLLGAVYKDLQIRRTSSMLILIVFDVLLMKGIAGYCGWDISHSMQQMKFPPNIIYLLYSLLAVVAALWGKRYLVCASNLFCRIGRAAIWFYFSQGISSSLLYFVPLPDSLPWYGKLPVMFSVNIAFCVVLVIALAHIWTRVEVYGAKLKDLWGRLLL